MTNPKQNLVWMDIPVADLDRASRFYEAVLSSPVRRDSFQGVEFGVLDHDGDGACLIPDPEKITAELGPLIYLNVDGRIREATAKVRELGGTVVQDVHAIGPHGWRTLILDSEGNRLALHSPQDG